MKQKTKIFIIFIVIFILFYSINSFLFKEEKVNISNFQKSIFDIIQETNINLDNSNNNIDGTKSEEYKNIINTKVVGKGFFVNEYGEFLTNSHLFNNISSNNENKIVNNNNSKYYIIINKKKYDFEIIKIYQNKDLILGKIINYENKNNFLKIQPVKKVALAPGKKIYIYKNNKKVEGKITGTNKYIKEYNLNNLIETDLKLNFGDSGSPLFNQYGEIIGINTAINGITNKSYSQIIK